MIELHKGTIEVHSDGLAKGSDFIVRLPLTAHGEPVSETPPVTAPAAAASTFVITDDNVEAAESLAMLLQLRGHEVHIANDGEGALQLLKSIRPRFALLDIGMPNMNGHQVAAHIRASPWGAPITLVALTGWGQESDRQAALAAGFDHHFIKPVDLDSVLGTLLPDGRSSKG